MALTFLGQISTASLPAIEGWPADPWDHGGQLIRVFADLVDCPYEPGPALGLAYAGDAALAPAAAPALPEPFPGGGPWDHLEPEERVRELPEVAVRPTPFLTAPETDPVLHPEEFDFSDTADRYRYWSYQVRADGNPDEESWGLDHHVLGDAQSIQGDVRMAGAVMYLDDHNEPVAEGGELADPDAWRVLLCVNEDRTSGLHSLDGGAYTASFQQSISRRAGTTGWPARSTAAE